MQQKCGQDMGTKFVAKESLNESRKRWLMTGYSSSKGEVILDDGAINAIKNSSLLPAGVIEVSGNFSRGDIVAIKNVEKKIIGWGIANYSSKEISKIKGMKTKEMQNVVDKNFGSWDDIKRISQKFSVMGDVVLNHGSSKSKWFENFLNGSGPGSKYFLTADKNLDLSTVTRPRTSDLLSKVDTANGEKYVWCLVYF